MQRSKVHMLPKRLREQVEQKLVAHHFSHYRELEEWLAAQGYTISRSSLNRFGQVYERRLEALRLASEQARALQLAAPDSENALGDALIRLVQERLFGLLIETHALADDDLPKIARAISDLGRASVSQKRWREEIAERLERARRAADSQLGEIAERAGLSAETAREIRSVLLGIDPLTDKPFGVVKVNAQQRVAAEPPAQN